MLVSYNNKHFLFKNLGAVHHFSSTTNENDDEDDDNEKADEQDQLSTQITDNKKNNKKKNSTTKGGDDDKTGEEEEEETKQEEEGGEEGKENDQSLSSSSSNVDGTNNKQKKEKKTKPACYKLAVATRLIDIIRSVGVPSSTHPDRQQDLLKPLDDWFRGKSNPFPILSYSSTLYSYLLFISINNIINVNYYPYSYSNWSSSCCSLVLAFIPISKRISVSIDI